MPEETLPADTELVKFVKIRSRLLSEFHKRPIDLRAGVILPRDFAREPERRYPVRVHIGGYGSRFTDVAAMMNPESGFHRAWMADDTPPMILIHLDGAGPLGRPVPGRLGQPRALRRGGHARADPVHRREIPRHRPGTCPRCRRRLDRRLGGAGLQIFYPEFFNGALGVLSRQRRFPLVSACEHLRG